MKLRNVWPVFVLFWAFQARPVTAETGADALTNDEGLLRQYQEFNQRYFAGELPLKDVYINWGEGTGTWITQYEGEPLITRISIGEYLQGHPRDVCMDILHEMAHSAVRLKFPEQDKVGTSTIADKDDVAFQNEMLRLANTGAFRDCW